MDRLLLVVFYFGFVLIVLGGILTISTNIVDLLYGIRFLGPLMMLSGIGLCLVTSVAGFVISLVKEEL